MKIRNIVIILLISFYLFIPNMSASSYVATTNFNMIQIDNEVTDNDYLPPVYDPEDDNEESYPADEYDDYDDGGTYYYWQIWTFRIVIVLIIGTGVVFYIRKRNKKSAKQNSDF